MKAAYERQANRPIDRLWVVFDKDSFLPDDFNSAIIRCKNNVPEIGCAWSNEAFELWYLLHFHYYNAGVRRNEYQRMIENNLKPVLGNGYSYEKNDTEMYAILKEYGSMDDAIRNAKRLCLEFGERQDYANHNPCTTVYTLVEELFNINLENI